jgi:hypothetical protein
MSNWHFSQLSLAIWRVLQRCRRRWGERAFIEFQVNVAETKLCWAPYSHGTRGLMGTALTCARLCK